MPVDDEPEPFWDGDDADARFAAWAALWFDPEWGMVSNAARFNGSSGQRLTVDVLTPLAVSAGDVWATDCLDLYRASAGVSRRLEDTYELLRTHSFAHRLPPAQLLPHPDTATIVRETVAKHLVRLDRELRECAPELIVTLGEAAASILGRLIQLSANQGLPRVRPGHRYGRPVTVRHQGNLMRWMAIKHPGQRSAVYCDAHADWIQRVAQTWSN